MIIFQSFSQKHDPRWPSISTCSSHHPPPLPLRPTARKLQRLCIMFTSDYNLDVQISVYRYLDISKANVLLWSGHFTVRGDNKVSAFFVIFIFTYVLYIWDTVIVTDAESQVLYFLLIIALIIKQQVLISVIFIITFF